MDCKVEVIRKNEHKTAEWSGGTTTQLYIHPKEAQYDKRNFLFRISSAKVEVDESNFTHLPGIHREIMILDGELELKHEGHHTIRLNKFDKDSFKGDWTTRSYGKVTDFNLMTNNKCEGTLEHIELEKGMKQELRLDKHISYNKEAYILYVISGKLSIELEAEVDLSEGDLLVLSTERSNSIDKTYINNNFGKESHVIISKLYFN